MRIRIFLVTALLLVLSWTNAFADIPPKPRPIPPPNPNPVPLQTKDANMVVEVDPSAKEPRLIIPRSLLTRRAGLDADDDTRLTEGDAPSKNHLIIAGAGLACAMCCGGFWLVRRNRLNSMGLVLFLVMGAGLVGAAIVLANAPPPVPKPVPPAPAAKLAKLFDGKVKVETPAEGDTIRLIANQEMLEKIVKETPTPPASKPE
jgi:hypothetical protein